MWLYRERKDDVIWSNLKLGSQLELNAILFQSWSKIRSNSKLPSIIITNISQSSPDTTSWFTEDINILRLTFKVCSLMCTSWSSANQISNFKFSAFFRVLFALWSLKYPHPKSQQTPRVSTELEMVVNLSYSFIPLQKILQKGVDRLVENPRKGAENFKMTPNAPNKFYRRMRRQDAPPPPCWATYDYWAQIWGANKLTGKMVLIPQQEEWISLLVMVLFSAMFSYFILDSFEPEKMVCLTKNGATFSSLNLSRRTYCSSYDEHACQTIIFSSCRKLKNQSLKLIVIAFCKKCLNCHRVIIQVPGDMSSQARW